MKIFYKIIASGCACFFLITAAYADTVVLKSGKTLEGKIVEQANDYVKIDVGGTVLTYFNDEIEKISNPAVVSVKPVIKAAPAIAPKPVEVASVVPPVEIKSSGFEIQAPQGWFTSLVAIGASGNQNTNIRYTKEPEGKIGSIPQISVVMDSIPEGANISNACDFAKYVLVKWGKVVEDKKGVLNVIENPSLIEINGVAGCGLVAERKTASGKTLKIMDFKFIKDKTVISIQCLDWLDNFDNSTADFEAALNTFKFK